MASCLIVSVFLQVGAAYQFCITQSTRFHEVAKHWLIIYCAENSMSWCWQARRWKPRQNMFSHQHHINLKRISMDDGKGDLLSGSIRNLRHVSCLDHAITPTFERLGLTSCHFTLPCQAEVLQRENSRLPLSFNYRTRVRSLVALVTNSLTNWLTHSLRFSRLDWCHPGVWRCQLQTC